MARAIVLGGGMVGSAMAMDLAEDFDVTVVDARPEVLERVAARPGIKTHRADVSETAALKEAIAPADIVLGALSSKIGFSVLGGVIDCGKHYCDISFMPEDAGALSHLAKKAGVTCVVDCGVAPGISNMAAGYAYAKLDCCQRIEIYVGGLPLERRLPYQYKAGFAPHDVIEEYTRSSRLVEQGQIVTREALSEPELIEFSQVGTLEAFNTDGLRSLVTTLAGVPFLKEKTLRYPGHLDLIRTLRDTGYFSKEPIEVAGKMIRPLDLTAALLFPKWSYAPGEADLTVMRILAQGREQGSEVRYRWDLLDRYHPETDCRSMSRTTAFPATIMARMIASGELDCGPGVFPPEIVAQQPGIFEAMLSELGRRGIQYQAAREQIAPPSVE